ncbi:MAG TPA: TMEM175 family protein [Noviherbaspirillum sp.]|nr:TMEM175 family protein [Noviherbaspirillum sp.]
MKVPHGDNLAALLPVLPVFLSYVLSFIYVGIYWNNHHHLLHAARHIDGRILWHNLHLLFWLSLFPFATAWMGENHFSALPTALYGVVLLMAATAYHLLVAALIRHHGVTSEFAQAFGSDTKGKLSIAAYLAGAPLSVFYPWVGYLIYIAVALGWFIPDRRVEKPAAPRD